MSIPQSLLETIYSNQYSTSITRRYWGRRITAMLTPEDEQATATIISREDMVLWSTVGQCPDSKLLTAQFQIDMVKTRRRACCRK